MQLVFLALQQIEKTFDPFVLVLGIALENQAALFGGELPPRHVRRNSAPARPSLLPGKSTRVARFRPRLDGAVSSDLL